MASSTSVGRVDEQHQVGTHHLLAQRDADGLGVALAHAPTNTWAPSSRSVAASRVDVAS